MNVFKTKKKKNFPKFCERLMIFFDFLYNYLFETCYTRIKPNDNSLQHNEKFLLLGFCLAF